MVTGKPTGIIYFDKNGVQIISSTSDQTYSLAFEPGTVSNIKIANEVDFGKKVRDFVKAKSIQPQKLVLILSENLFFKKTFGIRKSKLLKDEIQAYLTDLPFEQSKIASITYASTTNTDVIAANRDVFLVLIKALGSVGFKILYVVPDYALGGSQLKGGNISDFLNNKKLLKSRNIFSIARSEATKQSQQDNKKWMWLVIPVVAAGFLVIGSLMFKEKVNDAPVVEDTSTGSVSEEPVEPSAEAVEINRSEYKINILNGTGVAGLAGDTKASLVELEYSEIEVGNASSSNAKTIIQYLEGVPEEVITEITEKLKETFAEVEAEQVTELDFDIEITTGDLL